MKKFGLIGYPLAHSFSKEYFTRKFLKENLDDHEYLNFPINTISGFPQIIEANPDLVGLNVTIPFKEQIIPFLDDLDFMAKKVSAVNTIKFIEKHGKKILKGYNTDIYGFSESLKEVLNGRVEDALILGSGGASKAVAFVLDMMGVNYHIISRKSGFRTYGELDESFILNYKIIINTTPLGTFPEVDTCPEIPYRYITPSHILFDLIYNPAETLFLKRGKENGATISNGLKMLHLQAQKSWEIWNS